jgi:murein DD-endopeptidase MepM/ murein hydrolase activator NlpD
MRPIDANSAGAADGISTKPADRPAPDATETYQQMEATILRQLLSASGAFKPSEVAGGKLRADMFIETVADAVAKGGGLGIARLFEDAMGGDGGPGDAAAPSRKPSPAPRLSRPSGAPSAEVTSGFGQREDPISGAPKFHTGIDLRAVAGTPIRASAEGVVRRAGPRGGYGNAIEVDHGGGVSTLYAHASELLVRPGEKVNDGQVIGRVGQTGHATGPHLHFEVRKDNRPVDPREPTQYGGVVHRALNAYQRRVEDTVAGKVQSARGGDEP